MIREKEIAPLSGFIGFVVFFLVLAFGALGIFTFQASPPSAFFVLVMIIDMFCFGGFFIVNPNEAKVLQLFGRYVGTVRQAGWKWANPLYTKRRVSLRIRNFESNKLKVNDNHGSPIE